MKRCPICGEYPPDDLHDPYSQRTKIEPDPTHNGICDDCWRLWEYEDDDIARYKLLLNHPDMQDELRIWHAILNTRYRIKLLQNKLSNIGNALKF